MKFQQTSIVINCKCAMSRYSKVSAAPSKLVFVKKVIGFAANERDLRFGREWVIKGTAVRSFSERSKTLNEVKLAASSGGIDGSSLFESFKTLRFGNAKSGAWINEMLPNESSIRLFSNPLNTRPYTSSSMLFERSRVTRFGSVANAASSNLTRRLFDKSSLDNRCEDNVIETVPSV